MLVRVDVNQNGIYIWGSHYSVAKHMHREEKITASRENGPVVAPWTARVACKPISVITCHVRHNYILRPGLLPHLHFGLQQISIQQPHNCNNGQIPRSLCLSSFTLLTTYLTLTICSDWTVRLISCEKCRVMKFHNKHINLT